MDAASALTSGAIPSFFGLSAEPTMNNAVLQALHIKPMAAKTEGAPQERYRVILSDGSHFVQAMLGPQNKHLIVNDQLKKNSIVQLVAFQANVVNTKRLLILSQLEVLEQYGTPEKIGVPVSIDTLNPEAAPAQPQNVSGNQFYGTNNAEPQKPQQTYQKPQAQDSTYGNIYPIESLSPYAHKWTIRARVTKKSPIRSWHNQKGEGRLFSVTFLDESGEIRATTFNSVGDNFDRWFELLQEGSVYYVSSPCAVKIANKKFSQANNDYELTFERDTVIEKAQDQSNVPSLRYNFIPIQDLEQIQKDTVIDCIGVIREIGEVGEINSKSTGKPFSKREVTIVDTSRHQVRLTLWGDSASTFEAPLESVVAFQGLKVSDFGGRSLSLLSSGSMAVDPDMEEAHKLKGWYDAQGRTEEFASHSALATGAGTTRRGDQYKTIAQVKEENLGQSDEVDYFVLKATVLFIKHDENKSMYYDACRSEKCNRKVIEHEANQWHCESCNLDWDAPERRYILSLNVADHTGQIWMSGFDEPGKTLLGKSADELHQLRENAVEEGKKVLDEAMCKTWVFRCRAKLDSYQDTSRVRYQISSVTPVNFSAEATRLSEMIKQYSIEDNNSMFVQ